MFTARVQLRSTLEAYRDAGLVNDEARLVSPQGAHIILADGRTLLNLCANDYLGLANHPQVIAAAHDAPDRWGFGMASGRGLCGTQELHTELERAGRAFAAVRDRISTSGTPDHQPV